MKPDQRTSLTRRLALSISLLLIAGGALVSLAALAYGRQAAQTAYDRLLLGSARQVVASTSVIDGRVMVDIPVSAFELLALAPEDRVVYRIIGHDGQTLTGYDSLVIPDDAAQELAYYNLEYNDEPIRVIALSKRFAERAFSGTIQVLIGQTMRARNALAQELVGNAVLVVAVVGLSMAILAIVAVYSALRPLYRIERSFSSRDPRDLTPLHVAVPSELTPVVNAINRFMSRLERQMETTNNLIADSAHQLRTPIAALRAQTELATEESDPAALSLSLQRIHARSRSLSRLTDQLLNRALIIHRNDSVVRTRVDLRTVAMETADEFDIDSQGRARELRLQLPEFAVWVRGDALSLREACKNLVNNAFVHGQAPVTLTVEAVGDQVVLAIQDQGKGIPIQTELRAGERFVQADVATTRPGTGIGLAIVQEVLRAHDGKLRFSSDDSRGFRVSMVFPADWKGSDA
ncbi:sensor histidine kinase [Granulosicoccus sp. 3-233]|uniref:sensor histidine kinase n=1 Tax=Granulosicoccus sp. 3-233 TaxID=3417969 RepID=UPI003D34165B